MQEETKLILDHITYIRDLLACSNVGLVQEAQKRFNSMIVVYGIVLKREQYGCMVDLLSHDGYFKEAKRLMKAILVKPKIAI